MPGFSISVPAVSVPPAVADQPRACVEHAPAPGRVAASSATPPAARPEAHAAAAEHVLRAARTTARSIATDTRACSTRRPAMPTDVAEYTDCSARINRALQR